MRRFRVIPSLLLEDDYFVKTSRFKNPVYLGDPQNILRIFNDKMIDEVCILDRSPRANQPNFDLLKKLVSQCFVPAAYGGHVSSLPQIETLVTMGFEKIVLGRAAYKTPELVREASKVIGSQSVVASIDIIPTADHKWHTRHQLASTSLHDCVDIARFFEDSGAGEILLQNVDRDGSLNGIDANIIEKISNAISIPLIYCGGIRNITDIKQVQKNGAAAAAVGAAFVFVGRLRAVLVTYPSEKEMSEYLD